jgi:hypothetical protein
MPAEAGIQLVPFNYIIWIPAFAGMTSKVR